MIFFIIRKVVKMFNLIEIEGGIRAEYAESGLLAFELRSANALAISMETFKQAMENKPAFKKG